MHPENATREKPSIGLFSRAVSCAVTLLVLFFGLTASSVRANGQLKPTLYNVGESAPAAVPCSKRYGKPKFAVKLETGPNVRAVIENAFGADSSWGVAKNVSVVTDAKSQHAFIEVRYPTGSTVPTNRNHPKGGAGFYSAAGLGGGINAACLWYLVRFPEEFDFVLGGKLPGLFGGFPPPSGGARPAGDGGFTVRPMWRKDGQGELYFYVPNMVPSSSRGGMQMAAGKWRFRRGEWTTIEIELVLNAPGRSNGKIHFWINGEPRIFVKNIRFRDTVKIDVGGLMFSTFFGGKAARFAPDKPQRLHFDGFRTFGERISKVDQP